MATHVIPRLANLLASISLNLAEEGRAALETPPGWPNPLGQGGCATIISRAAAPGFRPVPGGNLSLVRRDLVAGYGSKMSNESENIDGRLNSPSHTDDDPQSHLADKEVGTGHRPPEDHPFDKTSEDPPGAEIGFSERSNTFEPEEDE